MIYEIFIQENRNVISNELLRGVQGEVNAMILKFKFPARIATLNTSDLNKYIIFKYSGEDGSTKITDPLSIINDEFEIPGELTGQASLEAEVLIKKDNVLLFKSAIFEILLDESLPIELHLNFDDLDVLNTLIDQYKEMLKNGSTEIEKLKTSIIDLTNSIQTEEDSRIEAENIRKQHEEERVKKYKEIIEQIKDMTESYNSNATEKLNEFNENAIRKENVLNDLASEIEKFSRSASENAKQASKSAEDSLIIAQNSKKELSETVNQSLKTIDLSTEEAKKSLSAYETAKELNFESFYNEKAEELENKKTTSLEEIETAKEEATKSIDSTKNSAITELNNNATSYEKKHVFYRLNVNENLKSGSEIELETNYTVGNNSLEIFYCGERLVKNTDTIEGSYEEIGNSGTSSNKVKILFDVPKSNLFPRFFDFVIRGGDSNA